MVIVTLDTEAAHGELVIDQVKTLVPTVNPVMVVVGDKELVITPLPEIFTHVPTPIAAALAVMVALGLVIQIVWFAPALETVGNGFTVILTLETDEAQGRFEMVHRKTFIPGPRLVMVVAADSEFVMVPDPEIKVHAPVPIAGTFAAMVALGDEIQTV